MNHDDDPISPPPDAPARTKESTSESKAPWRTYRSRHRQDQDDAAHAEKFEPPPIIEHAEVPQSAPELITDAERFTKLILDLRAAGRFAFDTEFIGENTYYPHLCLIQAGTKDGVWLIDPFEVGDLKNWWKLLADPSVEKIVHAGEQDLEPVQRLIGKPPANIFDTQIAGGFAGLDYPLSLVRVVEAMLEMQLDAGAKFSRWDRRPLSDKQRHYAASDVRYLPAIRTDMGRRINELGNTQLALDACDELCALGRYVSDPLTRKVKAKGVHKLNPRRRAVLNALLLWREGVAESLNLPSRSMLPDEGLMSLATELPRNSKEMQRVKFLPRPVREQMGDDLLVCITEALDGPHPKKDRPARYDRTQHRNLVNTLWDQIESLCTKRSIHTPVITSKRELGLLIAALLEGRDLPTLRISSTWRQELLGELISADALSQLIAPRE